MFPEDDEEDIIPFSVDNAEDHTILMHRDAHFGGDFTQMLAYYKEGGIGAIADIDIPAIEKLAALEKAAGKNMAASILSVDEIEKIARAKKAYIQLRDLYDAPTSKNLHGRLIADLIFAEDENPTTEIAAIAAEKGAIVPDLLALLRSEDFADPLFPGYGMAPNLAARCLGAIGDKRAMISLFEAIGESSVFAEEYVLDALKAIGEPAKTFLMTVVQGKPYNRDNEQAAIALLSFADDPEVSMLALNMLQDPLVLKDLFLSTHLILICASLKEDADRKKFASLSEKDLFPRALKQEVSNIVKTWA